MTALQEEIARSERAIRWHATFNARVISLGSSVYIYDADGNHDWEKTNHLLFQVASKFADGTHGKLEP